MSPCKLTLKAPIDVLHWNTLNGSLKRKISRIGRSVPELTFREFEQRRVCAGEKLKLVCLSRTVTDVRRFHLGEPIHVVGLPKINGSGSDGHDLQSAFTSSTIDVTKRGKFCDRRGHAIPSSWLKRGSQPKRMRA